MNTPISEKPRRTPRTNGPPGEKSWHPLPDADIAATVTVRGEEVSLTDLSVELALEMTDQEWRINMFDDSILL